MVLVWINLHRHDCYSIFDGFGTAGQSAKRAKEIGQTALGLTNHGNVCGLIEHYKACRDAEIKPILGVEAYFQPRFDKEKPRYHLTLLAKDLEGYRNIMRIITEANRVNFYRTANVDFDLLKKFGAGLVVMSGCAAGYIAQMVQGKQMRKALKAAKMFQKLFGEDFYLEVQPYEFGPQKGINRGLIAIGEKLGIEVVLTADSHYMGPEDYDTYQMMHRIAKNKITADYSERYMPSEKDVVKAWKKLMDSDCQRYVKNTVEIADKCNVELEFPESLPKQTSGDSKKMLWQLAIRGLKQKKKMGSRYKKRLKRELGVIYEKGFEDYFLLCHDLVSYARGRGIAVGYGRGSVCGSLLAYAIGLTQVDPLQLGTYFERFLRPNRTTLPDIDMDFDSDRRGEVIDYILRKYEGKSAPIATFGYYKAKNLINDLGKAYEVDSKELAELKSELGSICDEGDPELDRLLMNSKLRKYNVRYPDLLKHFSKLYGQVRFIGRHAAGVAIADTDITDYVALMRARGDLQTSYDMDSLETINLVKVDILGLNTLSVLREIEESVGANFDPAIIEDREIYRRFCEAETNGIFQFESEGAKEVLRRVQPANIQELIACTGLNRPAPIKLGILDEYIEGKHGHADKSNPWYKFTKDTYGTIVYQEHVMQICRELAGMGWDDVDQVIKNLSVGHSYNSEPEKKFVAGAKKVGLLSQEQARDLYQKMTAYLFNKGHGAGYTLISAYMMWLKIRYPLEFYYALLKNERVDMKRENYKAEAVKNGVLIFLPHVNGGASYEIAEFEGEKVIREGLTTIKFVGQKSAELIKAHAPYANRAEFIAKCNVNSRVMSVLDEAGALEFDQEKYMRRVERYCSSLYARSLSMG